MKKLLYTSLLGFGSALAAATVLTTADGGADAGIDFGKRDRNFGGQPEMMVKRDRNSAPALTRCALFRFDLAKLAEPVNDAQITLTLSSQGEQSARWKYDFRLYAVGTPDWQENAVTFATAPGVKNDFPVGRDAPPPAGVVPVGDATLPAKARPGDKLQFDSAALTEFLNANRGKAVTFLLVRRTESSQLQAFAAKEHGTFAPPELSVNNRPKQTVLQGKSIRVGFAADGNPEFLERDGATIRIPSARFWEFQFGGKTYNAANAALTASSETSGSATRTYQCGKASITFRYMIPASGDRLNLTYTIESPKGWTGTPNLVIGRIGGLAATPDSRIVWPYRYGQLLRGDLVKNYVERPAPGHMWMQFMGHYTPDAGLLWYVEDALGFLKFASHGKERDGKLVLGWRERPWLDGSGRYELPFPYVFVPFGKCDYHDFAAVYADWARQQPWAQVSAAEKLAARPALANAVFDGKVKIAGFEAFGGNKHVPLAVKKERAKLSVGFADAEKFIRSLETQYGVKPAYRYDGWWGAFDVGYPDLFPVSERNGGNAAFEKFAAFTRANRSPVTYYMNPINFDEESDTYRITQSVRQLNGEIQPFSFWSGSRLRMVSPQFILPGNRNTFDHFKKYAIYGGVFVDQIGGSSPYLDFNDLAGYEYYGKDSNSRACKEAFRQIRAEDPAWMIGTEDGQEQYLDSYDFAEAYPRGFSDAENLKLGKGATYIPLNELVYGDKFFNLMGIDGNNRLTFDGMRVMRRLYGTSQGYTIRGELPYWPLLQQEFEANDVIGEAATERMLRHRIDPAGFRASVWPSVVVIGNTDSGRPLDIAFDAPNGMKVEVKALRPDGFAAVTRSGKWILWGGRELKLDGKLLAAVSNPDSILVANRRGVTAASYGFVGKAGLANPNGGASAEPWNVRLPGVTGSAEALPSHGTYPVEAAGDGSFRFAAPGAEQSIRFAGEKQP